jgi:hypothetical protein
MEAMAAVTQDLIQDIPVVSITSNILPMQEPAVISRLKENNLTVTIQDNNLNLSTHNSKFINNNMVLERLAEVMMLPQKVLRVWNL